MKAVLLIFLALLAACTPQPAPQENATETTPEPALQANVSVQSMIDEFDALDAQYNTTWKKEQIPKNMIKPEALQPWTDHTLALRNITPENSLAHELILARLEMLSAQTAVYLGAQIGEKGSVPISRGENDTFTAGTLDCANAEPMAKATKLYQVAFHSWQRFAGHMDTVLQFDASVRSELGVDESRMPFYQSSFKDARQKIGAAARALEEQCRIIVKLEPEPEIPQNLPIVKPAP